MNERKQISKKIRFEVLKRDSFKCQYCGATPTDTLLHIDHITPVALGGKNNLDNLITACASCNLGKSATPLSSVAPSISMKEKAKEILEREKQIRAYSDALAQQAERIENDAWEVVFSLEGGVVDRFNRNKLQSIKSFLEKLPFQIVVEAAEIANARMRNKSRSFAYFCGICWNKIRENDNA